MTADEPSEPPPAPSLAELEAKIHALGGVALILSTFS